MEGLRYVDIFATKGIEYIAVIAFLLILVLFWRYIDYSRAGSGAVRRPAAVARPDFWFDLVPGYYYHPAHAWARPVEEGLVLVGMDDFAQKLLGKADRLELPRRGEKLDQGGRGWSIGIQSKSIDMLSPVEGEVVDVNHAVVESPELLNEDPYGEGWLLKVRVDGLRDNLKNLLSGRFAGAWMEAAVDSLMHRASGDLGVLMQDGGTPLSGIARSISESDWDRLAREFLTLEETREDA